MRTVTRITAFLLMFVMALSSVPPVAILANLQSPVPTLNIVTHDAAVGDPGSAYNIGLTWGVPPVLPQNPNHGLYDPGNHPVRGFDVIMRNATLGQPFQYFPTAPLAEVLPTNHAHDLMMMALAPSSIYSFQVIPWHMHRPLVTLPSPPNPPGTTGPGGEERAPYSVPFAQMPEAMFLTDIEVTYASAAGNALTVEWNHPTFLGQDIFSGYRIYWRRVQPAMAPFNRDNIAQSVHVSLSSDLLESPGANMLRYTFNVADGLLPGEWYVINVEPTHSAGQLVRGTNPMTSVLVADGRTLPLAFSQREYTGASAYVQPVLTVGFIGQQLRLSWIPFIGRTDLQQLEIWSSTTVPNPAEDDNRPQSTMLVTFSGLEAQTMWHFLVTPTPTVPTFFQFRAIFDDGSEMFSTSELFNPQDADFLAYAPTIINITDNSATAATLADLSMGVDFRAFVRPPYTDLERNSPYMDVLPGMFLDRNIVYDVFVTDRLQNLMPPGRNSFMIHQGLPASTLPFSVGPDVVDDLGHPAVLYTLPPITEYVTVNDLGIPERRTQLDDNTVYYILIVARRVDPITGDESNLASQDAFGSHYIPPYGPLHLRPQSMQSPPLRTRVENGIEQIGTDEFTIQWQLRWVEVYDPETNDWYTIVGVNNDGRIVYGRAAAAIPDTSRVVRLYPLSDVPPPGNQWLPNHPALAGANPALNPELAAGMPMRVVDLSAGVPNNGELTFEMHVVEYDQMIEDAGSYDDYLLGLWNLPAGHARWTEIDLPDPDTEGFNPAHPHYTITSVNNPPGAVEPNTAYVVFVRPVISVNQSRTAWWPAYIAVTTLDTREPLAIRPTTPRLEVVHSMTDMTSITVRWNYTLAQPPMDYNLRWHELITAYPEDGVEITPQDIRDNSFSLTPGWIYYTITGLFPNTMHYFWINAEHVSYPDPSPWSNPVEERTHNIQPPAPPTGLGIISGDSLEAYNREHGTTWRGMGFTEEGETRIHHMIIQWMRIHADFLNNTDAPETRPDGSDTFASVPGVDGAWMQAAIFDEIGTYVARLFNLRPNRRYYLRARTVLTVTRRGELGEGIYRLYSYRLQISETEDFTDFFEIRIPALEPPDSQVDSVSSLRAESDWTRVVSFVSGRDEDVFDGVNPDMFPLPDQDFEVTYDSETQTLRYRFRSDQVGADGLRDQQVDQRFISRLVANRTFNFEIDMSFHRDYLISRRVVEMPYSIFAAFQERQINFRITSGPTTLVVPYGALDVAEIAQLPDFGRTSTITFIIDSQPGDTPYLTHVQAYSTNPQSIAINVASPTRTLNITSFAREVGIELTLNDPAERLLNNVTPFWSHPDIHGWQPLRAGFNEVSGVFSTSVYRVGTFAIISTGAPLTSYEVEGLQPGPDNFSEALYIVNSAIIISDLIIFDPDELIEANQFNNIMLAFMTDSQTVAMNRSMPRSEHQSLGRAGLLATGAHVQNDAAISTFARLYELRTRSAIQGFSGANVADIDQARPQFREGILKAAHVELFEGNRANPRDYLTFGEFMHMLSILIVDAG
ncbi:MAG: fibronectin type III domain-containing protein [Defluviitaleaceae bacterium]|nr:fibronectin type III domain-containing protein [Defluviitaleaceae bacterium]